MTEEQIPQEKEKELTPMQEMLNWIQIYCDNQPYLLPEEARPKATELLAKERQAIEEAWDNGNDFGNSERTDKKYFTTRYKQ